MPFLKEMTLKSRMALAVSLLFVLFAATSALFAISHMEREFRKSVAEQQYILACTIAYHLDEKLNVAQKSLIAATKKVPAAAATDSKAARKFLDERVTLHSLYDNGIYLFDKSGRILAGSPENSTLEGKDFSFRDYFRRTLATAKPVISPPFISRHFHHQPSIMMTAPALDDKGEVAFIFCGSFLLQGTTLLDNLPKMKIGRSGYVSLSTSDRITLMHPNPSRVMQFAEEPGRNRLFDQAVAGFNGSGEAIGSSGFSMLTSFAHLRTVNWIVGIHNPVDEAYDIMYVTRSYLIAGFAAGTFAILGITWLVMRRMTLPLMTVIQEVEGMRDGQLRPVSFSSSDEIGTLAAAFNRLIETVHRQQEDLQEEERKYRIVADNTYDWEFWLAPDHRFLYSSPSCKRLTGFDPEQFSDFTDMISRITLPEDRPMLREHQHVVREKPGLNVVEFRVICADGSIRWISHTCHPVYDEKGVYLGIRGTNSDITERREAEQALHEVLHQQQAIIDNIPDLAWLKDREGKYITVNEQFSWMSGWNSKKVVGKTDADIWPPELADKFTHDDEDVISTRMRKYIEEYMIDRGGKAYCMETSKTPVFNARNEVIGIIGIAHDITARKEEEQQLRHANSHDTLTGLYNRSFFDQELERVGRGRKYPISLIMADLNNLKWINDTLGHASGDRLLRLAAHAILDAFREEDIVARIGGDEFAVLLPETDESTADEGVARIRNNVAEINRQEAQFQINIALGVATATQKDELMLALRMSDERMYADKATQKAAILHAGSPNYNPLDTC